MTHQRATLKPFKKNINGILLLDKPVGLSSNAALQKVKRLFQARKAGHTGSLDPLATGMLPICFGEATKFSQYLLDSNKEYRVRVKLGIKTKTGDAEGEIIEERSTQGINEQDIMDAIPFFKGKIQQIPPMFSALKVNGKPLYELARKGIEIERQPRAVQIYDLDLIQLFTSDEFELHVHCSKGTYVRTLVEDMGEKLGCGAHVAQLRRVAVSPYQDYKMVTIEELEAFCETSSFSSLMELLLPLESSVQALPVINLSNSSAFYVKTGQAVMVPHLPLSGLVRLYESNQFLGVGEILEDGKVAPRRLLGATFEKVKVAV